VILYTGIESCAVPGIPDGTIDAVVTKTGLEVFDGGTARSTFDDVRDGTELVISPSFIDMHSHSDLYRFKSANSEFCLGDEPKVSQGCGIQVLGQDGYSAAPVRENDKSDYSQFISGLDGELDHESWSWQSFDEYLCADRAVTGTKTVHLVGHSTLRRFVSGMARRELTQLELSQMCLALEDALRAGAVGMSTGLVYAPASFSNAAELRALAGVLSRYNSVMFVHLRSESYSVLEAAEEVADVCASTGCRLHISHIKTAGAENWRFTPHLIALLNSFVENRGLLLSSDMHPYIAGSTMATVLLPGWFQTSDVEHTKHLLSDEASISRARSQILDDVTSWDNWWRFSGGWSGIRFSSCRDPRLLGRPISELLSEAGVMDALSNEAFRWFFKVLIDSELQASIVSFNNCEENLLPFLKLPYMSLCTDGLICPGGKPHPRTYGTFPRLFRRFVRELNVLDMRTAVEVASVRGRGVVGYNTFDDLVVFRPKEISDLATYDHPTVVSRGIASLFSGGREIYAGLDL